MTPIARITQGGNTEHYHTLVAAWAASSQRSGPHALEAKRADDIWVVLDTALLANAIMDSTLYLGQYTKNAYTSKVHPRNPNVGVTSL